MPSTGLSCKGFKGFCGSATGRIPGFCLVERRPSPWIRLADVGKPVDTQYRGLNNYGPKPLNLNSYTLNPKP